MLKNVFSTDEYTLSLYCYSSSIHVRISVYTYVYQYTRKYISIHVRISVYTYVYQYMINTNKNEKLNVLVFVFFCDFFNEKLYRSLKSYHFSIETHFVVTEYAYLIPEKCLVFIFAYTILVKYLPIVTMAHHYEHWPIFY